MWEIPRKREAFPPAVRKIEQFRIFNTACQFYPIQTNEDMTLFDLQIGGVLVLKDVKPTAAMCTLALLIFGIVVIVR